MAIMGVRTLAPTREACVELEVASEMCATDCIFERAQAATSDASKADFVILHRCTFEVCGFGDAFQPVDRMKHELLDPIRGEMPVVILG